MHRFSPVRRGLAAAVCVPLAAILLALTTAAAASGDDKRQPPRTDEASAKVDRNGNKLFDDLEARFASAVSAEHVNVIVTLTTPVTSARVAALAERVGGFRSLGRRRGVRAGSVHAERRLVLYERGSPADHLPALDPKPGGALAGAPPGSSDRAGSTQSERARSP